MLAKTPPRRLRDRFKKVAKNAEHKKTSRWFDWIQKQGGRKKPSRDDEPPPPPPKKIRYLNEQKISKRIMPPIRQVGTYVRVVKAWRGFNSRFVGREGYVTAVLPTWASYDVRVKFLSRRTKVDPNKLESYTGTIGEFRCDELEAIRVPKS